MNPAEHRSDQKPDKEADVKPMETEQQNAQLIDEQEERNKEKIQEQNQLLEEIQNTVRELQHRNGILDQELAKLKQENKQLSSELNRYKEEERKHIEEQARIAAEQKKERERTRGFILQTKVSSFPDFQALRKCGIFLTDFSNLTPESKRDFCFYVVNHTARLESVNLDWGKYEEFRQKVENEHFKSVVVLAMSPGNASTTAPAPKQLSRTKDTVITLWYSNGEFNDRENEKSYETLKNLLNGH